MNITPSEAIPASEQAAPMKEAYAATNTAEVVEEICSDDLKSSKHESSSTKKKSGGWWASKKVTVETASATVQSNDLEVFDKKVKDEVKSTVDENVGQSKEIVSGLLPVARLFRRGISDTSDHKPNESKRGGWFSRQKSQPSVQANSEDEDCKGSNASEDNVPIEDSDVVHEDSYDEQFLELFGKPEVADTDRPVDAATPEFVNVESMTDGNKESDRTDNDDAEPVEKLGQGNSNVMGMPAPEGANKVIDEVDDIDGFPVSNTEADGIEILDGDKPNENDGNVVANENQDVDTSVVKTSFATENEGINTNDDEFVTPERLTDDDEILGCDDSNANDCIEWGDKTENIDTHVLVHIEPVAADEVIDTDDVKIVTPEALAVEGEMDDINELNDDCDGQTEEREVNDEVFTTVDDEVVTPLVLADKSEFVDSDEPNNDRNEAAEELEIAESDYEVGDEVIKTVDDEIGIPEAVVDECDLVNGDKAHDDCVEPVVTIVDDESEVYDELINASDDGKLGDIDESNANDELIEHREEHETVNTEPEVDDDVKNKIDDEVTTPEALADKGEVSDSDQIHDDCVEAAKELEIAENEPDLDDKALTPEALVEEGEFFDSDKPNTDVECVEPVEELVIANMEPEVDDEIATPEALVEKGELIDSNEPRDDCVEPVEEIGTGGTDPEVDDEVNYTVDDEAALTEALGDKGEVFNSEEPQDNCVEPLQELEIADHEPEVEDEKIKTDDDEIEAELFDSDKLNAHTFIAPTEVCDGVDNDAEVDDEIVTPETVVDEPHDDCVEPVEALEIPEDEPEVGDEVIEIVDDEVVTPEVLGDDGELFDSEEQHDDCVEHVEQLEMVDNEPEVDDDELVEIDKPNAVEESVEPAEELDIADNEPEEENEIATPDPLVDAGELVGNDEPFPDEEVVEPSEELGTIVAEPEFDEVNDEIVAPEVLIDDGELVDTNEPHDECVEPFEELQTVDTEPEVHNEVYTEEVYNTVDDEVNNAVDDDVATPEALDEDDGLAEPHDEYVEPEALDEVGELVDSSEPHDECVELEVADSEPEVDDEVFKTDHGDIITSEALVDEAELVDIADNEPEVENEIATPHPLVEAGELVGNDEPCADEEVVEPSEELGIIAAEPEFDGEVNDEIVAPEALIDEGELVDSNEPHDECVEPVEELQTVETEPKVDNEVNTEVYNSVDDEVNSTVDDEVKNAVDDDVATPESLIDKGELIDSNEPYDNCVEPVEELEIADHETGVDDEIATPEAVVNEGELGGTVKPHDDFVETAEELEIVENEPEAGDEVIETVDDEVAAATQALGDEAEVLDNVEQHCDCVEPGEELDIADHEPEVDDEGIKADDDEVFTPESLNDKGEVLDSNVPHGNYAERVEELETHDECVEPVEKLQTFDTESKVDNEVYTEVYNTVDDEVYTAVDDKVNNAVDDDVATPESLIDKGEVINSNEPYDNCVEPVEELEIADHETGVDDEIATPEAAVNEGELGGTVKPHDDFVETAEELEIVENEPEAGDEVIETLDDEVAAATQALGDEAEVLDNVEQHCDCVEPGEELDIADHEPDIDDEGIKADDDEVDTPESLIDKGEVLDSNEPHDNCAEGVEELETHDECVEPVEELQTFDAEPKVDNEVNSEVYNTVDDEVNSRVNDEVNNAVDDDVATPEALDEVDGIVDSREPYDECAEPTEELEVADNEPEVDDEIATQEAVIDEGKLIGTDESNEDEELAEPAAELNIADNEPEVDDEIATPEAVVDEGELAENNEPHDDCVEPVEELQTVATEPELDNEVNTEVYNTVDDKVNSTVDDEVNDTVDDKVATPEALDEEGGLDDSIEPNDDYDEPTEELEVADNVPEVEDEAIKTDEGEVSTPEELFDEAELVDNHKPNSDEEFIEPPEEVEIGENEPEVDDEAIKTVDDEVTPGALINEPKLVGSDVPNVHEELIEPAEKLDIAYSESEADDEVIKTYDDELTSPEALVDEAELVDSDEQEKDEEVIESTEKLETVDAEPEVDDKVNNTVDDEVVTPKALVEKGGLDSDEPHDDYVEPAEELKVEENKPEVDDELVNAEEPIEDDKVIEPAEERVIAENEPEKEEEAINTVDNKVVTPEAIVHDVEIFEIDEQNANDEYVEPAEEVEIVDDAPEVDDEAVNEDTTPEALVDECELVDSAEPNADDEFVEPVEKRETVEKETEMDEEVINAVDDEVVTSEAIRDEGEMFESNEPNADDEFVEPVEERDTVDTGTKPEVDDEVTHAVDDEFVTPEALADEGALVDCDEPYADDEFVETTEGLKTVDNEPEMNDEIINAVTNNTPVLVNVDTEDDNFEVIDSVDGDVVSPRELVDEVDTIGTDDSKDIPLEELGSNKTCAMVTVDLAEDDGVIDIVDNEPVQSEKSQDETNGSEKVYVTHQDDVHTTDSGTTAAGDRGTTAQKNIVTVDFEGNINNENVEPSNASRNNDEFPTECLVVHVKDNSIETNAAYGKAISKSTGKELAAFNVTALTKAPTTDDKVVSEPLCTGPAKKKVAIPSIFGKSSLGYDSNHGQTKTLPVKKKVSIPSMFGQSPHNDDATVANTAPEVQAPNVENPAPMSINQDAKLAEVTLFVTKKKVAIPTIFGQPATNQALRDDQGVTEQSVPDIQVNKGPTKKKVSIPLLFSQSSQPSSETDTANVNKSDPSSIEVDAVNPVRATSATPTKKKVAIPSIFDKPSHQSEVKTKKVSLQDKKIEVLGADSSKCNEKTVPATLPTKKKVAIPSIFGQVPSNEGTISETAPIPETDVPKAAIPSNTAPVMKKKVAIPSIFGQPSSQQAQYQVPAKVSARMTVSKTEIEAKVPVLSLTTGSSSHDTDKKPPTLPSEAIPCITTSPANDVKVTETKETEIVKVIIPVAEPPNPTSVPGVRKRVAIPSIFGKPPEVTTTSEDSSQPTTSRKTKKLVIPSRFGGL